MDFALPRGPFSTMDDPVALVNKSNFCVLPFIHLSASPKSEFRLCCIAKRPGDALDGEFREWSRSGAAHFWNSDYMQSVRNTMLTTENRLSECGQCYHRELIRGGSKRTDESRRWIKRPETLERIRQAACNAGRIDAEPIYLDLRLGNLCNLKCRMCTPVDSSKWYTELRKNAGQWQGVLSYDGQMDRARGLTEWYRGEPFVSDLERILPHVQHIYVTGGEPTIIPELARVLRRIADSGAAGNILLRFNTNAVELNEQWQSFLPQFGAVSCDLSIDGYGACNEWLRSPSNWEAIDRNVRRYCRMSDQVRLSMNTVVSVYNALYLEELFRWRSAIERDENVSIHHKITLLTYPRYMRATLLPGRLREEAIGRTRTWPEFGMDPDPLVRLLSGPVDQPADSLAMLGTHTRMVDGWRGEDYLSAFPDLEFIADL